MKPKFIMSCLGAGVLGSALGVGCASPPVEVGVPKLPQAAPAKAEITPSWRTEDDASASSQVAPSEPTSTPLVITKPEAKKLDSASLFALADPLENKQSAVKSPADLPDNKQKATKPPADLPEKKQEAAKLPAELPENKQSAVKSRADLPENKQKTAKPSADLHENKQPAAKPAPVQQTKTQMPAPAPTTSLQTAPVKKATTEVLLLVNKGHAKDYSWISGQLYFSRFQKNWRVRYAGLDEVDPYGGSVTLVDDVRLAGVKDGQFVRVEGRLMNPEVKAIAPPYELTSIQVVEK